MLARWWLLAAPADGFAFLVALALQGSSAVLRGPFAADIHVRRTRIPPSLHPTTGIETR